MVYTHVRLPKRHLPLVRNEIRNEKNVGFLVHFRKKVARHAIAEQLIMGPVEKTLLA